MVPCGCGNTFETRSTVKEIHAEICSMCHPFYTGKQKYVDTAGRIERFQKKYGTSYIKAAPLPKKPENGATITNCYSAGSVAGLWFDGSESFGLLTMLRASAVCYAMIIRTF